ncbi:MAG: histone deacetylase superfamily [Acidobacteriaceae bacterium]|nr:histone deacetylase superfamily [Acidobacteriaceae bacterium]
MSRRLFYCDHHAIPLPPRHRFPISKYKLIRDLLSIDGVFTFEQAPFVDTSIVELAHDPEYVGQFLRGTLSDAAIRRIGFPWSEGLVRRTLASVGGTLSATQDAFEKGWGGNLAGGTHHAFRAAGAGFCVFNDIAIAIHWLRSQNRIRRAAVLDLDVHQGDGTAEIFADDPETLTVSIHCKNNFPFRKQQSNIDVDLRDGVGDEEYLRALDLVLPRVVAFAPEIIFYQSGVDGLDSDALGRLSLSHVGLKERDRRVMAMVAAHSTPLVVTLGGGYSVPIELTAEAHANTYRMAAEIFS